MPKTTKFKAERKLQRHLDRLDSPMKKVCLQDILAAKSVLASLEECAIRVKSEQGHWQRDSLSHIHTFIKTDSLPLQARLNIGKVLWNVMNPGHEMGALDTDVQYRDMSVMQQSVLELQGTDLFKRLKIVISHDGKSEEERRF